MHIFFVALRRPSPASALVAALVLALCGCGGGSDTAITALPDSVALGVRPADASAPTAVRQTLKASAGPDQTVEQASTVTLAAMVSSSGPSQPGVTWQWQQTGGPAVTLRNAMSARPTFTAPFVSATVALQFALTVSAAGAAAATDSVAVTVQRDNPWGVAPSAALSYNPERWLPAMGEAGVSTVRGFFSSPTVDRLPPITSAGMSPVGILQWSASTPYTLPVHDLAGWRRYVTAQVSRYKGRVRHWEVWNEPPNFTADRSPLSYAKVVAAAYEAAKAVDPTVQIGLAAKSNHINWLAETIAAGAADKFDFVTLHPYEVAGLLPQGWEGPFMGIVPRVRKLLLDKNPARASVPVWFTEIGGSTGTPAATGPGPDLQADLLVKIHTLALAQGVARSYWFDPSDSEGLTMGLSTATGVKRPAWFALRALRLALGPRPAYKGWTQPGNAVNGFVFSGAQGVVLVAWAAAGQSATLPLASGVTAVDPRSGSSRALTGSATLTDAPVLLSAPTGSAQALQWQRDAAATAGRAFAWHGDHSAVMSVSLTAGSPHDGLALANPPPVTVVGGVPEFNFTGRGGPTFAVDPAFLSYSPTPVRITVVLRGLGSGDPGFNLKYEAAVPIAQADGNGLHAAASGWTRVTGTSLVEKTWTLPDARFIGLYGFNFSLDSDGPAHAQFSIHKVTLSR